MYRTVFFKSTLFFLLVACQSGEIPSLPYYNTPDFSPIFIQNQTDYQQQISHTIAPFSMTNQHGQIISERTIEGKIHVANFMFTRCTSICPKMTNNLKEIQQAFRNETDVQMLSFSVTPWLDSVPALQNFSESYDITAKNWHLLTGNTNEIYRLARQSYFAEEALGFTKDSTDFLHTERVLLIDKNKHIRGVYNGTLRLEMDQLKKDILTLKQKQGF